MMYSYISDHLQKIQQKYITNLNLCLASFAKDPDLLTPSCIHCGNDGDVGDVMEPNVPTVLGIPRNGNRDKGLLMFKEFAA